MSDSDKPILWVGSAREDLSAFPRDARQIAGHQLRLVQKGKNPDHWKPMPLIGAGVAEIIINTGDAFRVFYVATFPEGIYVLHAFNKKTRRTAKRDIRRGRENYRAVIAAKEQAKQ